MTLSWRFVERCLVSSFVFALRLTFAAGDESVTIQDFEKDFSVNAWPPDKADVSFDTGWSADGRRSLLIRHGSMAAIESMKIRDWSAFQTWRIHVKVPGNSGVNIGLELADEVKGYHNRHQNSAGAPPGESALDIDIGGDLWRGERNRPYRENKSPIHKDRISRFAITATGGDVYLDRVELVKVPALVCEGGYAFDLGGPGQPVQSQWIGIEPGSRWDESRGYGITPGASALKPGTPYPTLVMGDGIRMGGAQLQVNLAGGRYVGWIVFERSGFWEGEQAVYTKASLLANGGVIHSHTAAPGDPWFLLQDVEALTQEEIVRDMVMARQKDADISFDAVKGRNSFSLAVEGEQGLPPRLAGVVLAPDTPRGRAFVSEHKKRQMETVARTHRLLAKERRDGRPETASESLVVLPLPTEHVMMPGDWPAATGSRPVPPVAGFAGMTVHRLLGLYAARETTVAPSASDLAGPGGVLTRRRVSLAGNHYLPVHGYDETGVWIETHDYRPSVLMRVSPRLSRSLLVSVSIPAETKPGKYDGTIILSCSGGKEGSVSVPFSVEVIPGTLPRLGWPVGLFFSGVPVPASVIGDSEYWRLSEDLFRLLECGSRTMLTAGPGYRLSPAGVEGAGAVRYLRLASKYGLDRKVVTYGGFEMSGDLGNPAVGRAWEAFRAANSLPDHYINSYDEPSLDSDFPPVIERLARYRSAGFKTIGWTSVPDPSRADQNHTMLVRNSYAAAFNLHSPETLRWANRMGVEAWVYNNGLSRYDQGVHLWRNRRAGAKGRVDWIASIVQGFQFDAMDGREPDLSCFYFHSRHGVLPAPRYLGVVEGGFDARLLSELERLSAAEPGSAWSGRVLALFREVESAPYRTAVSWEELERLRGRMLALFRERASR